MKFLFCKDCGYMVQVVKDADCKLECCGKEIPELIPGTTDAAVEKHVPAITVDGAKVSVAVGSVAHPMADVHYIEWICIETKKGSQMAALKPGDEPKAEFILTEGDKLIAAYAYCNLHGLWKAEA